jgi:hypothetical protein
MCSSYIPLSQSANTATVAPISLGVSALSERLKVFAIQKGGGGGEGGAKSYHNKKSIGHPFLLLVSSAVSLPAFSHRIDGKRKVVAGFPLVGGGTENLLSLLRKEVNG